MTILAGVAMALLISSWLAGSFALALIAVRAYATEDSWGALLRFAGIIAFVIANAFVGIVAIVVAFKAFAPGIFN